MTTWNHLDLETPRFWPVGPINLLGKWTSQSKLKPRPTTFPPRESTWSSHTTQKCRFLGPLYDHSPNLFQTHPWLVHDRGDLQNQYPKTNGCPIKRSILIKHEHPNPLSSQAMPAQSTAWRPRKHWTRTPNTTYSNKIVRTRSMHDITKFVVNANHQRSQPIPSHCTMCQYVECHLLIILLPLLMPLVECLSTANIAYSSDA